MPKKDQDTKKARASGQQSHDMGTVRHHLRSTAPGVGQYLEGWEQKARKWMWMMLGGASGPVTTPSVGKLTNCKSRCPPLPSSL